MLPAPLPSVIFQKVVDGAVLFEPRSEIYFGLNEVGARIWQLLTPARSTIDELCAELGVAYPEVPADTIRADVEDLLGSLTREGLVQAPPGAPAHDVAPG